MSRAIDREALRRRLRVCTELQRRIALERVVERLTDDELAAVLRGLVHVDEHVAGEARALSLDERIEAHVAATRRGNFRGEYVLRNAHGQRAPWQTTAWVATTAHIFDCALERARGDAGETTLRPLRTLTRLVAEVDERCDELVVFEDENARFALEHGLGVARELLLGSSGAPE